MELRRYEQNEQRFELCGKTEAEASDWKRALENERFMVQVSLWVIEMGQGPAYALRFRRDELIGDLVSWPRVHHGPDEQLCRAYVLRLQRAPKPMTWKTRFAVGPGLIVRDFKHPNYSPPPFFPPSEDFPGGYP